MIVRRYSVLLLLCFALFAHTANAASNVVISQVYGGGGNSGATFRNDFIELFNRGTVPVTLTGWSVQYASSAGTTWAVTPLTGTITLAPGQYFLVQEAAGTGGTVNLPSPDSTGTIAMSATAGKVALVSSATALTFACPTGFVDFVGYGGANCFEGVGPTVVLSNTTAASRLLAGCTDTDNNAANFVNGPPAPRNRASTLNPCLVTNSPPSINDPTNPIATVDQDSAPFTVNLSGSDDGGVYQWSATGGAGVSLVTVSGGQGTANYQVTLVTGFTGPATFTASLSDTVNPAVSKQVNIQVNAVGGNAAPTISTPNNPITTVEQNAAPFTVSLSGFDDGGVYNWSGTPGAGTASVLVTGGQGTAAATFTVSLSAGFNGTASFTASLSDNGNPLVTQLVNIVVTPAPVVIPHITISQVYGGGGNSGAPFRNDYVELYNPTSATVELAGWTLQYAAATGSGWGLGFTPAVALEGPIAPGEYYLIALASNGTPGSLLPEANATGTINLSGTNGKIALVGNGSLLSGNCPLADLDIVDFVGYGSADCREGTLTAPAPSNTTAIFRKIGGAQDTNSNVNDFFVGVPNPRRTAVLKEFGPSVVNTDPGLNGTNAPRDASITVNFSELVEVTGAWFAINCATSGSHNSSTPSGGGKSYTITPNSNFVPTEVCTVTVFKDFIHDQDLDDSDPNTDTLAANYVWTFTVATGTAPPYPSFVHLTMGNPSGAQPFTSSPNNYLMEKPELSLSYNRDKGIPNWVSWHLSNEWVGSLARVDTFRADPAVPSNWYRVQGFDYSGSGFDRGHMVPNADRDKETSIPINQATFLMTNMIPQAPDNNQGPWADMENDLRALLGTPSTTPPLYEMYIVAGGAGIGGNNGSGIVNTIANGHVTVPAQTWKVALVLPANDGNDVTRVEASTKTIAVIMPNVQGTAFRASDWRNYLVTVDQVEALTGFDFFSEVSDAVENSIEAGVNGVNPPGVENQSVSTNEDTERAFTLEAVNPDSDPLTYTVLTQPSHGTLSGSGANQTYTPAPDFNGTDSFTFKVSDGTVSSNTATVTITVLEVNDTPTAAGDSKATDEDTPVTFAATELATNDSTGPANESGQTLTVTTVSATADTHGTVSLVAGQVTYQPAANFNGPASFTYQVCDNGVTRGLSDSLCASSTVSISVRSVNDAPSASIVAPSTSPEGTSVTASVNVTDVDAGDTFTYSWTATKNGSPFAGGTGSSISFTPDDNGSYLVSVTVTDNGGATGGDSETVSVTNVAPVISSVTGPVGAIQLGSIASISLNYSDLGTADTHTAMFAWDDGTTSLGVCVAGTCTASRTYAAAGVYGVSITVSDDDGASASTSFNFVVVFNPNDSKVTGGGWINSPAGAVVSNPALIGKATFTVNSKYQKGENTPQGSTKLKTDGMDFNSTSYDWLVVARSNAQYKGTGTVNGTTGYGFLLTVTDGEATGGDGTDKFRIRIWELISGATVYDNAMGGSDDMDLASPQQIGSGSIVIHASN